MCIEQGRQANNLGILVLFCQQSYPSPEPLDLKEPFGREYQKQKTHKRVSDYHQNGPNGCLPFNDFQRPVIPQRRC